MEDLIICMQQCIFQPCNLVRHFPCPVFSSPAIWSVIFQVMHFPGLWFGPSFSPHYPSLLLGSGDRNGISFGYPNLTQVTLEKSVQSNRTQSNSSSWRIYSYRLQRCHLFRNGQQSETVSLQNVRSSVVDHKVRRKLSQRLIQIPFHTTNQCWVSTVSK